VYGVHECWLGAINTAPCVDNSPPVVGVSPVLYTLKSGEGFNVSQDEYAQPRNTYTIMSVYTNTTGFAVEGIYSRGVQYALPQSVYAGTNFPFSISVVATTDANLTGVVVIYVVTSSACCYSSGTKS